MTTAVSPPRDSAVRKRSAASTVRAGSIPSAPGIGGAHGLGAGRHDELVEALRALLARVQVDDGQLAAVEVDRDDLRADVHVMPFARCSSGERLMSRSLSSNSPPT